MRQLFHGNVTTAHLIKNEIRKAPMEVTNSALAKRLGINIQTLKMAVPNGDQDRKTLVSRF